MGCGFPAFVFYFRLSYLLGQENPKTSLILASSGSVESILLFSS